MMIAIRCLNYLQRGLEARQRAFRLLGGCSGVTVSAGGGLLSSGKCRGLEFNVRPLQWLQRVFCDGGSASREIHVRVLSSSLAL